MRRILITGADGVLGSSVVRALPEDDYEVYALDLKKEFMTAKFGERKNTHFMEADDLNHNADFLKNVDIILHCAFSRSQDGTALAQSIDFSEKIFKSAVQYNVPKVINISSQSIYGGLREISSTEDCPINPLDSYAVAKYACERLAENISENTQTQITSIRLASLIGPQFKERLVNKMILNAKNSGVIKIVGGKQVFSFLDIRDATEGLVTMIKASSQKWQNVYNLGTSEQYSIMQIAETISSAVFGTKIELNEQDINMQIRLDCSRFNNDFNWSAQHTLSDSVKNIIENTKND